MCGIAGIHRFDGRRVEADQAERLFRLLRHRGPDGQGFLGLAPDGPVQVVGDSKELQDCQTLFVHTRLAILDLSPAAFQPMGLANGRYWMVYNGEIYNYLELRQELEQLGHRFRSSSDTEVLLVGFSHWGQSIFPRLIGMFALAILDTHQHTLTLARDGFGIKPLYYHHSKGLFAFASEMKVLVDLPEVSRQVNPQRAYDYLRFGVTDHGNETLLNGIQQLKSGCVLELNLKQNTSPTIKVFWSAKTSAEGLARPFRSKGEAAEQFQQLFLESVKLHLRSDVPVGACLSGGIDSSSIVSAMRKVAGPNLDLHTFTYVAQDDPSLNEDRWASLVGQAVGATMHRAVASPDEIAADLERLVYIQDEPFASTSIYAQFLLYRLIAKQGIKVVLDGQGADELLGGYTQTKGARLASLLGSGQILRACRFLQRSPSRFSLLAYSGNSLLPAWLQAPFRQLMGRETSPAWLDHDWLNVHQIQRLRPWYASGPDYLRSELLGYFDGQLQALLRTEDRSSMAYSIESRVPFLTPQLFEFLMSLPEEYLVDDDGTTKAVLRQGLKGLTPQAILERKDKIGFVTPEQQWLKGPVINWVQSVLQSTECRQIPMFNHQILRAMPKRELRYVWRWVIFVLWTKAFRVNF